MRLIYADVGTLDQDFQLVETISSSKEADEQKRADAVAFASAIVNEVLPRFSVAAVGFTLELDGLECIVEPQSKTKK